MVSGMSRDLYDMARSLVGHWPGGLASATVVGCAGFAAVSGSSLASAVTMGRVALPEMKRHDYHPRLATGCVAAGGTLGILIPPSTGFIIYALLTEESIGQLFLAGVLPGLLLTGLFMVTIAILTRLNPEIGPKAERLPWRERARMVGRSFLADRDRVRGTRRDLSRRLHAGGSSRRRCVPHLRPHHRPRQDDPRRAQVLHSGDGQDLRLRLPDRDRRLPVQPVSRRHPDPRQARRRDAGPRPGSRDCADRHRDRLHRPRHLPRRARHDGADAADRVPADQGPGLRPDLVRRAPGGDPRDEPDQPAARAQRLRGQGASPRACRWARFSAASSPSGGRC